MSNGIKNIFIVILSLFWTTYVSAGVVPWTIKKWAGTTSVSCGASSTSYSPAWFSCACVVYKEGTWEPCWCMQTEDVLDASWAVIDTKCIQYNTCRNLSFWCEKDKIVLKNSLSYADYSSEVSTKTFWDTSYSVKLLNDMNQFCYSVSYGTSHTPPGTQGIKVHDCAGWGWVCITEKDGSEKMVKWGVSCMTTTDSATCILTKNDNLAVEAVKEWVANCPLSEWSQPYYLNTGSDWECMWGSSVDNIITSYNQLGSISRVSTTTANMSCTVEGRYATSDKKAPVFTVNGVSKVFSSDINQWCNIKKYHVGTNTIGCEYYRKLNTVGKPSMWEDLLKGLEISVDADPSGIWEVQVLLWKCWPYTYKPDNSSLTNILVSQTNPSWVKSTYSSAFTIKYNSDFTALWKTQKSLLSAFKVERLDECLEEWKNSMLVITKDMSRSEVDGSTLESNESTIYKLGTINIDNSNPLLKLEWDLTQTGWEWKNYTLTGNIKQWEKYMWPSVWCTDVEYGTGSCWTPPTWQYWVAPVWVNSTTWEYSRYKCDSDWVPSSSECKAWCISPLVLKNWKCVASTQVNGVCGSANGKQFTVAPTTNLCLTGTLVGFNGIWPWNWQCQWIWWTNVSCSAGFPSNKFNTNCMYRFLGNNSEWVYTAFYPFKVTEDYFEYVSETNVWRVYATNKTKWCIDGTSVCTTVTIDPKCVVWNDIPLTDTTAFDTNCTYKLLTNWQWTSAPDWVLYPKLEDGSVLIYDEWTSRWRISSTKKAQSVNVTTGAKNTIVKMESYCWFSRSDIWLTNNSKFSEKCRYRFVSSNQTYYISAANVWNINYSAQGTEWYIPNTNKSVLKNIANSSTKNVSSIQRDCNTTSATDGVCGSTNGTSVSTKPTAWLCADGTASTVSGTWPWTWTCAGINGGTNASCSAKIITAVNGVCGSANGTPVSTKPTTWLCSVWTASIVSGTWPWTWSCAGSNGSTSASCSANIITNGVCNNSVRGWCSTGTVSWISNTSACGATAKWSCIGSSGWLTSGTCSYTNGACACTPASCPSGYVDWGTNTNSSTKKVTRTCSLNGDYTNYVGYMSYQWGCHDVISNSDVWYWSYKNSSGQYYAYCNWSTPTCRSPSTRVVLVSGSWYNYYACTLTKQTKQTLQWDAVWKWIFSNSGCPNPKSSYPNGENQCIGADGWMGCSALSWACGKAPMCNSGYHKIMLGRSDYSTYNTYNQWCVLDLLPDPVTTTIVCNY